MKTRQELVLDFMLALATNYEAMYEEVFKTENSGHVVAFNRAAEEIYARANALTNIYLEEQA